MGPQKKRSFFAFSFLTTHFFYMGAFFRNFYMLNTDFLEFFVAPIRRPFLFFFEQAHFFHLKKMGIFLGPLFLPFFLFRPFFLYSLHKFFRYKKIRYL